MILLDFVILLLNVRCVDLTPMILLCDPYDFAMIFCDPYDFLITGCMMG